MPRLWSYLALESEVRSYMQSETSPRFVAFYILYYCSIPCATVPDTPKCATQARGNIDLADDVLRKDPKVQGGMKACRFVQQSAITIVNRI